MTFKLLYITTSRHYRPLLNEVNNTYRAAHAATIPGIVLGGPGFDGTDRHAPLHLPDYVEAHHRDVDAVFIADPWHNFWAPCDDYPNCPPLVTGIDDLEYPVIIESGDSQFYYDETCTHLLAKPEPPLAPEPSSSPASPLGSMPSSEPVRWSHETCQTARR